MTADELVDNLATLGIAHEMRASGMDGLILLLSEYGRVLGIWPHRRAENVLWVNNGFFQSLRVGAKDDGWNNPGGDRLWLAPAGEFLGEGCLIGQTRRLATATAITECVATRVDKAEILRVLRDEPAFSQMFITYVLARNARVEADLVDQLFNSTEKRLARVLLILANFGKQGQPEPITTKINQEMLAEMIGSTRSRVSHFMNNFRKMGFIEYNGHLEVHSSLLSVVLSERPDNVKSPP